MLFNAHLPSDEEFLKSVLIVMAETESVCRLGQGCQAGGLRQCQLSQTHSSPYDFYDFISYPKL